MISLGSIGEIAVRRPALVSVALGLVQWIVVLIIGSALVSTETIPRLRDGPLIPLTWLQLPAFFLRVSCGLTTQILGRRRRAADLATLNQKWQTLIAESPDYVAITDMNGVIQHISRTRIRRTTDEVIGLPVTEHVPPASRPTVQAAIHHVLRTDEPANFEITTQTTTGEDMSLDVTVKPVRENGRCVGLVFFGTDVTQHKQAQQELQVSQERLRLIMQYSSDGINIAEYDLQNHKRRLVACNDRYVQMSGRTREQLLAADDLNAFVRYDAPPEVYKQWHRNIQAGVPYSHRACWIHLNGTELWYEWTAAPVHIGDKIYIIGVDRDITAKKRAEEQLRWRQGKWAHAERINTMGQIAANLAHELNQPLGAIANFSAAAWRRCEAGNPAPGETVTELEQIALQAERAARIVRRVRDFVRKDHGHREPADVNQIVCDVIGFCELEARQKKVILLPQLHESLPQVLVDRIQIEQVVLNLVRNAIEALENLPGGPREVTVATRGLNDHELEVSVSDTGPGLSAEQRRRLFEPFFTTKANGLGMGIPISRSIVESHGGNLWPDTTVQGGTIIRFTIPYRQGEQERES